MHMYVRDCKRACPVKREVPYTHRPQRHRGSVTRPIASHRGQSITDTLLPFLFLLRPLLPCVTSLTAAAVASAAACDITATSKEVACHCKRRDNSLPPPPKCFRNAARGGISFIG